MSPTSDQTSRRFRGLRRTVLRLCVPALLAASVLTVAASAPASATTRIKKPGAPLAVTATPDNCAAVVSWTAPVSDGGSPVTGYTVTASHGGASSTAGTTTCTVTGLENRYLYTFRVRASNAEGNGPPGVVRASLVPVVSIGPVNTFYSGGPIDVTLSQPSPATVRVDFETSSDGPSAQLFWAAWSGAAASFHPGSGVITFAPGQTVAAISFTVDPTSVSGCSTESLELGLPCYPDAEVTLSNASHAALDPSPEVGLVYLP
jgi:hypothetical protein